MMQRFLSKIWTFMKGGKRADVEGIGRYWVIQLVSFVFLATCFTLTPSKANEQVQLRFPPQLVGESQTAQPRLQSNFNCMTVPAMTDMSGFYTFYKSGRTQSVVDRKAMAAYVQRTRLLDRAKTNLSSMILRLQSRPLERAVLGACIMRQILAFSDKNALLDNLDQNTAVGRRQAVLIGIWSSIKFARAYQVALQANPIAPEQAESVKRWFANLAEVFVGEFTPSPSPRENKYRWLDNNGNTRYWAGAAVGLLSVQLQDKAKFDWAMSVLHSGLDEVSDDGSFPLEIARGERALHYQSFAMNALTLLVSLADANKVAIPPESERKLVNATKFTIEMYNRPEILSERLGYKQIERPEMTEWLALLVDHIRPQSTDLARDMENIVNAR